MLRRILVVILALTALAALAPAADARYSRKKAIWGPTKVSGKSQFPIYRKLGVGIYQMQVSWARVAPTRPANPADPSDPAYHWPSEVDYAIRQGGRSRIRVSLMLRGAPPWANGGRSAEWAPRRPGDFAAFARAASRRYPRVHLWQIWGEPSRQANFKPMPRFEASGPRRYARILDAAYGSLKRQNRRNLVIGGNTFTTGDVTPLQFIRSMRLPNGRPPRMDLYGHNPFTLRRPSLGKRPLGHGYADFSDLDSLARWIDNNLRRPGGRPHSALPVGIHAADRPRELRVQLLGGPRRAGELAGRRAADHAAVVPDLRDGVAQPLRRAAEWPGRRAGRRGEPRAPGMGR